MNSQPQKFLDLKPKNMRGFSYNVSNGTILTNIPSLGIIYFLGNSLRFFDGEKCMQIFKTENEICHISSTGSLIAIGQSLFKGQLITTTILNLETKQYKQFNYQKTRIEFLSISKKQNYLASVGCSDQKFQNFFIIDIETEVEIGIKSIFQETYEKKKGRIVGVKFSPHNNNLLAILFTNRLVLAEIDKQMVSLKTPKSNKVREFSMVIFDLLGVSCLVSSKNGDISEINLKELKQVRVGPRKRVIISGIKHIRYVNKDRIIISGTRGFLALLEVKQFKILKQVTLKDEIISLTEFEGDLGFVSTDKASIYLLNAEDLTITPFYTSHNNKINKIEFAEGYSDIFATCAGGEIMIWRTSNLNPLLKIYLPGKSCLCINLPKDGKSIISGWNDDCIRVFSPLNGKQIHKIANAHCGKVTAMSSNQQSDKLASGADNGSIRIWKLEKQKFGMIQNIFAGHNGIVHYLKIIDDELLSCSEDGTFAIWNLAKGEKCLRVQTGAYLKKIQLFDQYCVLGVGSGSTMKKIRRNDGKVMQQIEVGGTYINDFLILELWQNHTLYFFGGEPQEVTVLQDDHGTLEYRSYSTYDEITCLGLSPDHSILVVGTKSGSILTFIVETSENEKLNRQ